MTLVLVENLDSRDGHRRAYNAMLSLRPRGQVRHALPLPPRAGAAADAAVAQR